MFTGERNVVNESLTSPPCSYSLPVSSPFPKEIVSQVFSVRAIRLQIRRRQQAFDKPEGGQAEDRAENQTDHIAPGRDNKRRVNMAEGIEKRDLPQTARDKAG